jgi:MFS superfamily sulfate permease-like transporter
VSWPVFRSLRGYQRSWLRGDVVAGLTVWAVLVPEAPAYASIAGVSPVVGLYAGPGRCCCTPPSAAPGTW